MEQCMERLDHPWKQFPSVHIAGTNGKGTVATQIAWALQNSELRVGLYTSPHITSFRERISVNGEWISESRIVELASFIEMAMDATPLSFFEWATAMAFLYFAEEKVDVAIIETGLGGRLDATNVITPLVSVITSIQLDHCEQLGETLDAIAYEKAGILKKGIPVVLGRQAEQPVIDSRARGLEVRVIQHADHQVEESSHLHNTRVSHATLDLLQSHFSLKTPSIEELEKIRAPCRQQTLTTEQLSKLGVTPLPAGVILDVSHNPAGISSLMDSQKGKACRVVAAFSKGKAVDQMLNILAKGATHLHLTTVDFPRVYSIDELSGWIDGGLREQTTLHSNVKEAIQKALFEAGTHQERLVICGTFFMMREALEALGLPVESDPIIAQELSLPKGIER